MPISALCIPQLRDLDFREFEKDFDRARQEKQRKPPQPSSHRFGAKKTDSNVQFGHNQVDAVRKKLETFDRHILQVEMHEKIMKCSNFLFYGDAVVDHAWEIMERNGWEDLCQELVISALRRFGKSEAIAQYCSSFIQVVKGCEVTVFSTGKRASGSDVGMMGKIREKIFGHFGLSEDMILVDNGEHLYLKFGENDTRKINAYPGSVHSYVFFVLSPFTVLFVVTVNRICEGERVKKVRLFVFFFFSLPVRFLLPFSLFPRIKTTKTQNYIS